jgi:hypothetical protein
MYKKNPVAARRINQKVPATAPFPLLVLAAALFFVDVSGLALLNFSKFKIGDS